MTGHDGINVPAVFHPHLKGVTRRWPAAEVGTGGNQGCAALPAQRGCHGMGRDAHGDRVMPAAEPAGRGRPFRHQPRDCSRPGGHGTPELTGVAGIDERQYLSEIGCNQNQTLLPATLFQGQ